MKLTEATVSMNLPWGLHSSVQTAGFLIFHCFFLFKLNCRTRSVFPDENQVLAYKMNSGSSLLIQDPSFHVDESSSSGEEPSVHTNGSAPLDEISHSGDVLKFISQMLMEEEDLEIKPCMLHDCLVLQATEKSLYDVLNDNLGENVETPNEQFGISRSGNSYESSSDLSGLVDSSVVQYSNGLQSFGEISNVLLSTELLGLELESNRKMDQSPSNYREKKNRYQEDDELLEKNRSKQLANSVFEHEPLELYDDVLLCYNSAAYRDAKKKFQQNEQWKPSTRGRPKGGKKNSYITKAVVDLRSLLLQAAQAAGSFDCRTVNDLLIRIRQHSSPQGDYTERLAYYFANALEARLAGTGTEQYAAITKKRISAAEILKAYKTLMTACPFKQMSNVLANRTIKKLATGASSLHIIDFGILYGFQWPCLIRTLSERPGGPPKLRITGIDFPQPGFRPAERVAEAGHRLAKYCKRFGVPFEYNAIAQKWETIKIEDLRIGRKELLVVNSLYRLHNVPDETVMVNSPRDAVLRLIKKINPDMFIHGVNNGTYNTPFFATRFREALFHFSCMFDMFEATIPREDEYRLPLEREIYGKDALNVIACEGTERVDRPETYKQWQVRNMRAGFRQVPLDEELFKCVKNKVKLEYHKDFSVDEDGKWMLQGWKGRVIHALSFWKPANK